MSVVALWLLSAGLATLSAGASQSIRRQLSKKSRARRIADTATRVKLGHVTEDSSDWVRVVGRVELGRAPLTAPLSGRTCAHYEVAVGRKLRRATVRYAQRELGQSFWVADETGRAFVDLARAHVDVVHDHHWNIADVDAETRFELERLLYEGGPRFSRLIGADGLSYSEGVIEEGELVTVVGRARFRREPEPHFYRDQNRRLSIEAPENGSVFVSDGMHFE